MFFFYFQTESTDLCKDSTWTYHEHTVTCIKLFNIKVTYTGARADCAGLIGGPSGDQPGWLVGVHDRTTDMFVQSLLERDQKAFIGLHESGSRWKWDDNNPFRSSYTGWGNDWPTYEVKNDYDYVVTTKNGWENVLNNEKYGFVCQMYAAFPPPTITCHPSEEGKPVGLVECSVTHQSIYGKLKKCNIYNDMASPVVQCNPPWTSCVSFLDKASGTVSKENDLWKTTVTTERLTSRDGDGLKWSCNPEFEKPYPSLLISSCTMYTFVIPQSVECTQSISPSSGVSIECDVRDVFPEAKSIWTHLIDGNKQPDLQPKTAHTTHSRQDGERMYDSKFTQQFTVPGRHKIEITVYPNVPFITDEARLKASIQRTVEFTISVPHQPPVFSTENGLDITRGLLTVVEDRTVVLVCEVDGGSPQVSTTSIQCDGRHVKDSSGRTEWSAAGTKVSVELTIAQAMDQKVCICRAQHVTQEYKKEASITLNVPHAAMIDSFTVNSGSHDVEVNESNKVTYRCSIQGNPMPQLHMYKISSDGKTQTTLQKTINTSISYHVSKASCDMSGTYVCSAENSRSTETSEQRVNVRVRCRPQPCSQRESDREFSIVPNKGFSFTMCLFAYPKPHRDIQIGMKGGSYLNRNDYSVKFDRTYSIETKGFVVVNMSASVTQLGNYTINLHQSSWHAIDFRLVPYQKPSCPDSLNTLVASRFVTLSWQPASDRGIPQAFSVSTINSKGDIFETPDITSEGETMMSHNTTDLLPGSDYRFKLAVKNEIGVTECPHLTVNVTTNALPISEPNSGDMGVRSILWAISAVIIVLIIATLLVIVFMWRKKAKEAHVKTNHVVSEENPNGQSDNSKDKADSSSPLIGDVYATVNKPKKQATTRQESVYNNEVAAELHGDQNVQKVESSLTGITIKGDPVPDSVFYANAASTSQEQSNISAEVSQDDRATKKSKGKPSKQKNGKSTKKNGKKTEISVDQTEKSSIKKDTGVPKDKELVYVEVEIIPGGDRFRVKPVERPEPVDYASLNFLETAHGGAGANAQ